MFLPVGLNSESLPNTLNRGFGEVYFFGNRAACPVRAILGLGLQSLSNELSNLLIVTLGLGLRPTVRSSFEVVYHYYRQDEALAELRDSNLEVEPDGRNKELGQALDLVFGRRVAM